MCNCHAGFSGPSCNQQQATNGRLMTLSASQCGGTASTAGGGSTTCTGVMVMGVCTHPPPPPPTTSTQQVTCGAHGTSRATTVTVFGQQETQYRCACDYGYQGDACECAVSQLGEGTRAPHGSCTVRVGSSSCQLWDCTCSPGWTSDGSTIGHYCNVQAEHSSSAGHQQVCSPNPCQHGGTCRAYSIFGEMQPQCECTTDYAGDHCETLDHAVQGGGQTQTHCEQQAASMSGGQACLNGGTCTDLFGSYSCQCAPNYGGANCEQYDTGDDCSPDPCHGHGRCSDTYFGFECTCFTGWDGFACDQDRATSNTDSSDPCSSNPCVNNGVCTSQYTNNDYGYTCTCQPQYYGTHCEDHDTVNQCSSTSCCAAGGHCVDLFNDAMCNCHAGFSGPSCNQQQATNGGLTTLSASHCGGTASTVGGGSTTCTGAMVLGVCTHPPPPPPTTSTQQVTCGAHGTSRETTVTVFGQQQTQYRCVCDYGYQGDACECPVSQLGVGTRAPHGSCTVRAGSSCQLWDCTCSPGWISDGSTIGHYCNVQAEHSSSAGHQQVCYPNPCLHGGTCRAYSIFGEMQPQCECTTGYGGEHCQTLDQAAQGGGQTHCQAAAASSSGGQACLNGGTCTDLFGAYSCQCAPNYGGANCDHHDAGDDCSPDPCHGHGSCSDTYFGFECTCFTGWDGFACDQNRAAAQDPCSSNPCVNHGVCASQYTNNDYGYTCTCQQDTYGVNCDQVDTADQCSSTSCCATGGHCVDLFNDAMCNCHAGFSGLSCNQQQATNGGLTTLSASQCGGGSTSTVGGGGTGCQPNPCGNGGECRPVEVFGMQSGTTCKCTLQYAGESCECRYPSDSHGQCDPVPGSGCQRWDPTSAICDEGYISHANGCCNAAIVSGGTSGEDDPCRQNPCQNGGTCSVINLFGEHQHHCDCASGYGGDECDMVDQAAQHSAHCQAAAASSSEGQACLNGGTCTDLFGTYTCECETNYGGANCEQHETVDDCHPNPCQNGGTCDDLFSRFVCNCENTGYTGADCSTRTGPSTGPSPPPYTPSPPPYTPSPPPYTPSPPPYQGGGSTTCTGVMVMGVCTHPPPPPPTTSTQQVTCGAHGTSRATTVTVFGQQETQYRCACDYGYQGDACECAVSQLGEGTRAPHGSCTVRVGSSCQQWDCTCSPGWTSEGSTIGHYCNVQAEHSSTAGHQQVCSPNPCQHGGTCRAYNIFDQMQAQCECTTDYAGEHCETLDHAVQGGGQTQTHCEQQAASSSGGQACLNGGTCTDLFGSYSCQCAPNYGGANCEQYDTANDCSPDPCNRHGSCSDTYFGFECTCFTGWDGSACDQNRAAAQDPCSSSPCGRDGVCASQYTNNDYGYTCACQPHYSGTHCEIYSAGQGGGSTTCTGAMVMGVCTHPPPPPPTTSTQQVDCGEHGTSRATTVTVFGRQQTQYHCVCDYGHQGDACECTAALQLGVGTRAPHGDCTPREGSSCQLWDCTCDTGWTSEGSTIGHYCNVQAEQTSSDGHAQVCFPNPCQHGGTCRAYSVFGQMQPQCECPTGYGGDHCETLDQAAQGGGQTQTHCEQQAASSSGGQACLNGGTCTDLFGSYSCQCAPNYGGTNCEQYETEDDCLPDPCHGHGTCMDVFGSFQCECSTGWHGAACETQVAADPCDAETCSAHGSCSLQTQISGLQTAHCTCDLNYMGAQCETQITSTAGCGVPCCHAGGHCTHNTYAGRDQCVCNNNHVGDDCSTKEVFGSPVRDTACNAPPPPPQSQWCPPGRPQCSGPDTFTPRCTDRLITGCCCQ